MSYDVFFQGFHEGGAASEGGAVVRQSIRPYVASDEAEDGFLLLRCGGHEADVYLHDDSMMANHVTGEEPWDVLVTAARAAGWTILLPDGPVCLTDEAQRAHLPDELGDDAVLVGSGADLLAVIRR